MGTFTMPLKRAIELTGGTLTFVDGVTGMDGGNIGLSLYPIFDETHRPFLNGKIIDRYLNREIGMETIDMFQLAMRRKMNEIMPAYNLLYLSTQMTFDPLKTIVMTTVNSTTQNTATTGTANTSADTNSKSRSVASETPQTMLSPDSDYASSASDVNGQASNTGTSTENSTQDATGNATNTVDGYQGIPADLIMRYREAIINVDLMIINELAECFMQVWDNGDAYSNNYGWMY
jgi:hypothetical protein